MQDGVTMQWAMRVGTHHQHVGADIIVIARPMPVDDAATRHEFQAALFQTERAVRVVPEARSGRVVPEGKSAGFGRCIAIAWRDDSVIAKAVIPALPVLGGAGRAHLLAGVRKGPVPGIPAVLPDHGISANLHVLPIGEGPFGKVLLEKLHELGADMLMMGA